jgi:EmrB/QacA subfamily drug resistance transporter
MDGARVTPRKSVAVAGILLAMFLAATEATIIATAMPSVVADLGGLELYGWVGAMYMLATTVSIPIWGKLADLWGRKPVILAGITTFLVGSVACGLAPSMGTLIAARVLQGLGGGGVQPIAMTLMGDMFAPRERARIQGLSGAVWGTAAIIGPILGGVIVRALSWRWVFYLNVPFGLLAMALLGPALEERPLSAATRRIDVLGAALLSTAVLALLGGVADWLPAVLLPVAAAATVAFVLVELKQPEPLVPMDLMRQRVIAVSSAVSVVVGGVMTSTVIYLPLFAQSVLQASPAAAGATVAPMLIGWPIASALSGRLLLVFGARPLVRGGFSVVALSAIALDGLVHEGASVGALRACMFVFGIGMGLASTANIITVQDSVPFQRRGVATAGTMFFRTIGGAVLVGVLGAVLARAIAGRVPERVLDALLGPEHGRSLGAGVTPYRIEMQAGMAPLFHVVAAVAVVGAIVALLYPSVRVSDAPSAAAEPGE